MNCRFCQNQLSHELIDLGYSPPSNSFLKSDQLSFPEKYYPLKILICENCFLVQIDEFAKHNEIFNSEYAYFSSYSRSWLAHAESYVHLMIDKFKLDKKSQIVEIASNDGYLLQYFKKENIPVLGVEPTANTAAVAESKGIKTVVDFFGVQLATKLSSDGFSADLLLGNNVLAHVPNINDFVGGMKILLKPTGIITMEFPHLLQLIDKNQFDTIYHEHFSYLSFYTAKQIFEKHGLEMFHVEEISTHGGSLRIYAKHNNDQSKNIEKSVDQLLNKERLFGINQIESYYTFQSKADKVKNDFLFFLLNAKSENKKVVAYGAAAKGNTLLNYAGIKKDLISYIVDASPYKQGMYTPGGHIPVVNEDVLKQDKPDYVVILPWNLKEEVVSQLNYIRKWNAKFILPIPEFDIF